MLILQRDAGASVIDLLTRSQYAGDLLRGIPGQRRWLVAGQNLLHPLVQFLEEILGSGRLPCILGIALKEPGLPDVLAGILDRVIGLQEVPPGPNLVNDVQRREPIRGPSFAS